MPDPFPHATLLNDQNSVLPESEELDTGLFTSDAVDAFYLVRQMQVHFVRHNGILQVPVGAPVGGGQKVPCKIIRTHAPVEQKVVVFYFVRVGLMPDVPAPEPDSSNQRLIERTITPMPPKPYGQGGDYAFSVMGEYRYALYIPHDAAQDSFDPGNYPGVEDPQTFLTPGQFNTSLLHTLDPGGNAVGEGS
jgi:hypothetical protein